MRFRVKTYFEEKKDKSFSAWAYIFNLFYRSIIPLMLFYAIIEGPNDYFIKGLLAVTLLFFVLYQFQWGEP